MPRCRATKANGGACQGVATEPNGYCWAHAPENAEQRRRQASKAARAKPNREIKEIKALCKDLTQRVLAGELLPGPAAVANQLTNTRLRAVEAERRLRETEELEGRLEELERAAERRRGNGRWGA
jgi:hypothetical protein